MYQESILKFYNYDQVINDLMDHEHLRRKPHVLYDGMEDCLFHKLYSQVFPAALDKGTTIDDLNGRVSKFFDAIENVIPQLDQEIDEEAGISIYSLDYWPLTEDPEKFYAAKARFVFKTSDPDHRVTLDESVNFPFVIALQPEKRETTFWRIKQNA